MFDYSRMEGRFFEPNDKICLIFCNEHYGELRKLPEYAKRYPDEERYSSLRNEFHYPDMPRAREWANTFEEGIKTYGFSEDQIYRFTDADYSTMSTAI